MKDQRRDEGKGFTNVSTQRPTMEDVAAASGYSRALVSRAFRGKPGVSSAAKIAIFSAADSLGYRHNLIASRLASQSTNSVGLFMLDIYNELFADIYSGLRERVQEQAIEVILAVGTPDGENDLKRIENLLNMRVDVAVVAGTLLPDEVLQRLSKSVPLISVTRLVPGISSVATDDGVGGRLAAEHLLKLGHRHISLLAPAFETVYGERERAFADSMLGAGLKPQVVRSKLTQDDAHVQARELLSSVNRPTAIITHNDVMALGVLEAAIDLGLSVPNDLSIVGYDDTRVARHPRVNLTSVGQQSHQLGELAASFALDDEVRAGAVARHRLLNPRLEVRGSSGPAPTV
ncbi:LacI family DNA-binding transcriptional regulator [Gulosibacter chungangensis]|uniref:LacI family transcriptional regulator n=1 Tax=Gulosibacter chungangensis TaxID=979746 RepID=A0A7J5BBQ1_9MICO|nr:LacI family DNA-binding transcriptional regulator [Gulosibacter chungangensis]KAB1642702.1 LacI family transcriptional regulator [Gulosibacter chungangensis]